MAKHAKGGAAKTAKKVAAGTGRAVVVTAKGVAATGRGVNKTLNFCMHPFCLHDARTAKCKRKCCN